jgi:hypothetical protein
LNTIEFYTPEKDAQLCIDDIFIVPGVADGEGGSAVRSSTKFGHGEFEWLYKSIFEMKDGRIREKISNGQPKSSLRFAYAFSCFGADHHNSREYVLKVPLRVGRNANAPVRTQWVAIHTHCGGDCLLKNDEVSYVEKFQGPHYAKGAVLALKLFGRQKGGSFIATDLDDFCDQHPTHSSVVRALIGNDDTNSHEIFHAHFRREDGRIYVRQDEYLNAVMALRTFGMNSDGAFVVEDFLVAHEHFRLLVEEITPEKICAAFPSQLRYVQPDKIAIAPYFVSHVNFRFLKVPATKNGAHPQVFLPSVGKFPSGKVALLENQDKKYKVTGGYPYCVDNGGVPCQDSWGHTWRHGSRIRLHDDNLYVQALEAGRACGDSVPTEIKERIRRKGEAFKTQVCDSVVCMLAPLIKAVVQLWQFAEAKGGLKIAKADLGTFYFECPDSRVIVQNVKPQNICALFPEYFEFQSDAKPCIMRARPNTTANTDTIASCLLQEIIGRTALVPFKDDDSRWSADVWIDWRRLGHFLEIFIAKVAAVLALNAFTVARGGSMIASELGQPTAGNASPNFYAQHPEHKSAIEKFTVRQLCEEFPMHLRFEATTNRIFAVDDNATPFCWMPGQFCCEKDQAGQKYVKPLLFKEEGADQVWFKCDALGLDTWSDKWGGEWQGKTFPEIVPHPMTPNKKPTNDKNVKPDQVISLLQWLERQRYSMLRTIINTGEHEAMALRAMELSDDQSSARTRRIKTSAADAYRANGKAASLIEEDMDYWSFGEGVDDAAPA